jgi:hypothetical protein
MKAKVLLGLLIALAICGAVVASGWLDSRDAPTPEASPAGGPREVALSPHSEPAPQGSWQQFFNRALSGR